MGGIVVKLGDKTRTGYERFGGVGGERPVVCIDCGKPTTISEFGWELARLASKALVGRGEVPLANNEMTRCQPCAAAWHERENERAQEISRRIGRLFALAKQGQSPPPSAWDWLRKNGYHEDVKALNAILDRKRNEKPGKGRRDV
jgi:hypothetical protein